ncbi:hypothetical protein T484DRAFT_1755831 [Baffinella frigidus]|nr:hypothetical protein T484DRAFT_1755831 [Cryptophyta sp. CCMP2293]
MPNALVRVANPDELNAVERDANPDELASIVHMMNIENERRKDEIKIYNELNLNRDRPRVAPAQEKIEKAQMMINHLERLKAIQDMRGGVGGTSNAEGTTDIPPLQHHTYTIPYDPWEDRLDPIDNQWFRRGHTRVHERSVYLSRQWLIRRVAAIDPDKGNWIKRWASPSVGPAERSRTTTLSRLTVSAVSMSYGVVCRSFQVDRMTWSLCPRTAPRSGSRRPRPRGSRRREIRCGL